MAFRAYFILMMAVHLDGCGREPGRISGRYQEMVLLSVAQKSYYTRGKKSIFAGTSCGLFSTTELKGDSTVMD